MYYDPEIVPYISIKLKEPFNANFNKLEAEIKIIILKANTTL